MSAKPPLVGSLGLYLLAPSLALAHGEGAILAGIALPSLVVPSVFLVTLCISWIRGARLPRISTGAAVFAASVATYLLNLMLARSEQGSGPAAQVWLNFLWWALPVALPAAAWAFVSRWRPVRPSGR